MLIPRPSMMHREEPTLTQRKRHILTRQVVKVLISKVNNNGKELRKMMANTIIITKIGEDSHSHIITAMQKIKKDVPSIGRSKIGGMNHITPSRRTT